MKRQVASIGFGEAGAAFASGWRATGAVICAYDIKLDDPGTRASMSRRMADHGVVATDTLQVALSRAEFVFLLVTADQALEASRSAAAVLAEGSLVLDMNSVAPDTKRASAEAIERQHGRYVDVAIMAPVHPAGMRVPLLVSGPHAEAGAAALRDVGFSDVEILAGPVGAAAAVKMIRSVMIKGIEALTAECVLAAQAAGVTAAVIASLDASCPPSDSKTRADYNLDRMMVHGLRRAAEMEEAVKTLDSLGTGSALTRATVVRQREIGALGLVPRTGLTAKIDQLLGERKDAAA